MGARQDLTLIGPNVGRFGAGQFYADHDSRQPWRLAYFLDRPNGEMAEGFADWLAEEWSALLPEIAAAQPLHVRLRISGKESQSHETTVPLAINTAGPGDQLLVDFLVSGMIAKGWLKLNSAQNCIEVGAGFATEMDGVRYASDAFAILNGRLGGAIRQPVEELVGLFKGDPIETV